MKTNRSSKPSFPDALSLVIGAVLATVVLVAVYFVLPLNKADNQQDVVTPDGVVKSTTATASSDYSVENLGELEKLADIMEVNTTSFNRYLALYHLSGRADEARLLELFSEAVEMANDEEIESWGQQFMRVVLRRLVMVNVDKAESLFLGLESELQDQVAYDIVSEWASFAPEAAQLFVEGLSDNTQLNAARGVVDARIELPESELTQLAESLGITDYVARLSDDVQVMADVKDPEQAWSEIAAQPELLLSDNYDRLSNIVAAWVQQNGISVMDKVFEVLPDESRKNWLLENALRIHARRYPEEAFDYALTNDTGTFGYSPGLDAVVNVWANTDRLAALERVVEMDSAMQRSNLLNTVFRNWVEEDLQGLIQEIHRLPDSARDSAREMAIGSLMDDDDVETALTIFADIESNERKLRSAPGLAMEWMKTDPTAALNWALNDPVTESIRTMLGASVLAEFAGSDPEEAFEIALNEPLDGDDENAVGLEAQVLAWIGMSDVEKALKLLPKVREGATKTSAYINVGSGLAMKGRLNEAIDLGSDLPEADLENFYTAVGTSAISFGTFDSDSDQSIFDTIDMFPSDKARSQMALSAILFNSFSPIKRYSDDEIESLKEYLNDEDVKGLEEGEGQLDAFPMPFLGL